MLGILWLRGGQTLPRFAHFAKEGEWDGAGAEQALPRPSRSISLTVAADGQAREMELEQYLFGVVAAEMPASFESEALKAQAVAARTYTLRKLLHGGCGRSGADICTDSAHCQAYADEQALRERWGRAYEGNCAKIRAAVEQTAGQVLVYEGEVIEALFHSSSGGSTEDCAHVFAQDLPYLKSVSSPEQNSEATATFSYDRVIQLVEQKLGGCGLTPDHLAEQIQVLSRYESGRVQTLRLGSKTVSGNEARAIFSLRSADFSLKIGEGQAVFTVRGYGHGVGMSQYGADALAADGYLYGDILAHYYTGTELSLAERFL